MKKNILLNILRYICFACVCAIGLMTIVGSNGGGDPMIEGCLFGCPSEPDSEPPTTPTNLVAVASNHHTIILTWNPSVDNSEVPPRYYLYRNGSLLIDIGDTSFTDRGLSSDTNYCYTVCAHDGRNRSANSNQACLTTPSDLKPPGVPDDLTASVGKNDQIDLTWARSNDDGGRPVSGYNIFRDGTFLTSVTSRQFSDMGLIKGVLYCYTVSAYDESNNESEQSEQLCSTTWSVHVIDNEEGRSPSIAIDSADNIHISYQDYDNRDLKYATNASGVWLIDTLDSLGDVGRNNSIAIDSTDSIHISYGDYDNEDLKYATDVSGTWVVEIIDGNGGRISSIAIDSADKIHIITMINFLLSHVTNISGVWEVDPIDSTIVYTMSAAIDSADNIHISYQDHNAFSLKYATNSSGVWLIDTLDGLWDVGRHNSIATDSTDSAHIIHYKRSFPYFLEYTTNLSGSWDREDLDVCGFDPLGVRSPFSIAIDSVDNIYISYRDFSRLELKYIAGKLGAWNKHIIYNEEGVLGGSAIAVDSLGNVHIIYRTNTSVKYATNR